MLPSKSASKFVTVQESGLVSRMRFAIIRMVGDVSVNLFDDFSVMGLRLNLFERRRYYRGVQDNIFYTGVVSRGTTFGVIWFITSKFGCCRFASRFTNR